MSSFSLNKSQASNFLMNYFLIIFYLYKLPLCEHWQFSSLGYLSSNYLFLEALPIKTMLTLVWHFAIFSCYSLLYAFLSWVLVFKISIFFFLLCVCVYTYFLFLIFIVIQLQLYASSPHPSTPPQVNPPPSPPSTLPLGFVHVSFIVVPVIPSPHCPLPTPPWLLLDCS